MKNKVFYTLIFLTAAIFRLVGVNWDQGQHLHPDERFLTMVGTAIRWPKGVGEYFDTRLSSLNPYNNNYSFFVYGTFPLFLNKAFASILSKDDYANFTLLGRQLAAFFDLGVVLLLFKITGSVWAGLIYSLMVLPIQLSHFFVPDPFLNFFLVASFWATLRFHQTKKTFWVVLGGVFLGTAMACKISAVLFTPILAMFFLLDWRKKKIPTIILNGLILASFLFLTFRIFQPYAFDGIFILNRNFVNNLQELRNLSHPESLFPPSVQWLKTIPLYFPAKNIFLWGLGIPLGAICFLAMLTFPKSFFVPAWLWICFLFLFQGTQFVKPMRYFLPIYPFLALFAGEFLRKKSDTVKLVVLPLLLIWPISFMAIYLKPHSRVSASAWIYENIAPGSILSCEHWDDCLPLGLGEKNSLVFNYQTEMLTLFDTDDSVKWLKTNNQLEKIDYLILSSNRLWGSISKVPERYPQTAKFYQNLFAEKLNFKKVAEINSYPCFPPLGKPFFCFPDHSADESFTVYDHPQVIIFKKNS